MDDELRDRLETVERALTDGETDLAGLASEAAAVKRLDELQATVEELETQVAEQEAAIQAVRGYVGNVRSVNREVARRADAALAAADPAGDPTGHVGPNDERLPGRGRDGPPGEPEVDSDGSHGGRSDRCAACGRSDQRADHSSGEHPGEGRPAPSGSNGHGQAEGRATWPHAAGAGTDPAGSTTGGTRQSRDDGADKNDRLAGMDGSRSIDPAHDDAGPDGTGWAEESWRREDSPEGRARNSDRATESDAAVDASVLARIRNLL